MAIVLLKDCSKLPFGLCSYSNYCLTYVFRAIESGDELDLMALSSPVNHTVLDAGLTTKLKNGHLISFKKSCNLYEIKPERYEEVTSILIHCLKRNMTDISKFLLEKHRVCILCFQETAVNINTFF